MRMKVFAGLLLLLGAFVLSFFIVTHRFPSIDSLWTRGGFAGQATGTIGYPQPNYADQSDFKGAIFLQFAPMGSASSSLYGIDMKTMRMQISNLQYNYPSVSRDGHWIVGTYSLDPEPGKPNGVYTFDVTSQLVDLFARTDNPRAIKPVMSPDDSQVAYMSMPNVSYASKEYTRPEASSIYVVSKNGKPKFITHGAYPQWSPDGTMILYLGDNGLHLFDLAKGTNTTVKSVSGGTATTHLEFAVSNDGTKLALTQGETGEDMYIYYITDWKTFTLAPIRTLHGYDYSPVFAPDASAIAFLQYDPSTSTDPVATHRRLMIHTFKTAVTRDVADLSHTAGQGTTIDSWAFPL